MKDLFKAIFLVVFVFTFSGCYEDRAEITLNVNGSGSVRHKTVFSERLMVAIKDGDGGGRMLPSEEEELIKKIGEALKLTSITSTDLDDGGRIIEFEGTFSTPEQFFFSSYCQEQLNLRLLPGSDGEAVLYCQIYEQSGGSGPSTQQLYGLAKGMYTKRVVNLPGTITESNGNVKSNGNTVTWEVDLRNREGLARAKEFLEGEHRGKGKAVFDGSKLKFSLPLKMATDMTKAKTGAGGSKGELKAEVVWVSTESKYNIKNAETEISKLEIVVKLMWKDSQPVAYANPKLISIIDNLGNDLVYESWWPSQRDIRGHQKDVEITLKTKIPGKDVKELRNIQGQVEVVTSVVREKVVLENIHDLAGKESTGNAVLDKMNFKILSLTFSTVKIRIDGGKKMIKSLEILRTDGSKLDGSGSMGSGDSYTYQYNDDLSEASKMDIEVITSQETVTVHFTLERVVLP